jgi:hypothetical protein
LRPLGGMGSCFFTGACGFNSVPAGSLGGICRKTAHWSGWRAEIVKGFITNKDFEDSIPIVVAVDLEGALKLLRPICFAVALRRPIIHVGESSGGH